MDEKLVALRRLFELDHGNTLDVLIQLLAEHTDPRPALALLSPAAQEAGRAYLECVKLDRDTRAFARLAVHGGLQ